MPGSRKRYFKQIISFLIAAVIVVSMAGLSYANETAPEGAAEEAAFIEMEENGGSGQDGEAGQVPDDDPEPEATSGPEESMPPGEAENGGADAPEETPDSSAPPGEDAPGKTEAADGLVAEPTAGQPEAGNGEQAETENGGLEPTQPEAVDPVFPAALEPSPAPDFLPLTLERGDTSAGNATDTDAPEIELVMSYFYDPELRRVESYDPAFREDVYFWDEDGNLLDGGVRYRSAGLALPGETTYDIVYPRSEQPCFSLIMSDSGSGLAEKDFGGTQSPYFEYLLSRTPLTREQLEAAAGWKTVRAFETGVGQNDGEGRWIIYARAFDKAGNAAYVSSPGYVQDNSGPAATDIAYTAENETADGWAKSRTVTFRLGDPELADGTPGLGLDEGKVYIHNTTSGSANANLSAYGLAPRQNGDGTWSVTVGIWPTNAEMSVTAYDRAVNHDFTGAASGPNVRQNRGFVLDRIDSVPPAIESLAVGQEDVWTREKTVSAVVSDSAVKMESKTGIDDGGKLFTYPVPGETVAGSGVGSVFICENKDAGPEDENSVPASASLDLDGQAFQAKVDRNGTYYLVATDRVGNRSEQMFTVTTIDSTKPTVMEVSHTPETTEEGYLSQTDYILEVSGISDEKEAGVPGTVTGVWYGTENDVGKAAPVREYAANSPDCTIPVTPPDGATTYYVWAEDEFGNFSEPAGTTIYKDTAAPHTGQPYADPGGWTNKDEVTLTVPGVVDAASGIKAVLYAEQPITREGDGTEMAYADGTATVTVTPAGEGVHTYYFRAIDKAGNMGAEKTVNVSIDRSAPSGSIKEGKNAWQGFLDVITFGQYHREDATFTVEAEEPGTQEGRASGMASIEYYVREAAADADTLNEPKERFMEASKDWEWKTYTPATDISIPVDPNAKRVVYAKLADRAGNVTYISSEGAVFDNTPPAVSGLAQTAGDGMCVISFQITDNVSGVDEASVKYGETADGSGALVPIPGSGPGSYALSVPMDGKAYYIYAADRAGNAMTPLKTEAAKAAAGEADGNKPMDHPTPKTGDERGMEEYYLMGLAALAVLAVCAGYLLCNKKKTGGNR
ncbi:Ig-like domain repeat protein [Christensenella intestinihominis]|uniref:Ig-like domain repeat protein n=1 Tax=Christensenella intestinihominis TaxID=1851429 RepID=UPI00082A4555|nr:Ig-like domain repeat protein [Christensenella intestinihominis]